MKIGTTWRKAGLAVLVGGGIALAIPALPAVAKSSTPQGPLVISANGKLLAKGVAASVTVTATCNPGVRVYLNLTLTEASHKTVTQGYANRSFLCTGIPQVIPMTATLYAGEAAFVPGTAVAQAQLNGFGVHASTSASVKL